MEKSPLLEISLTASTICSSVRCLFMTLRSRSEPASGAMATVLCPACFKWASSSSDSESALSEETEKLIMNGKIYGWVAKEMERRLKKKPNSIPLNYFAGLAQLKAGNKKESNRYFERTKKGLTHWQHGNSN